MFTIKTTPVYLKACAVLTFCFFIVYTHKDGMFKNCSGRTTDSCLVISEPTTKTYYDTSPSVSQDEPDGQQSDNINCRGKYSPENVVVEFFLCQTLQISLLHI